jgi:polyhydroxybutyrate depolymerase
MKRLGIIFALLIAASFFAAHSFAAPPNSPHATETFKGRDILLYVPANLPAKGSRALVVVLHGGLGNASRIEGGQSETGLRMDSVADKDGFVVAYLNGTKVARMLNANMLGWNAGGGCCGVPAETNVDDVGYISAAVNHLVSEYGIDPARVFGIGHSNGAMMSMRLVCETNLYAAVISISGPLNLKVNSCPAAKGKRILSLHGADDENVPIAGGVGAKGISHVAYASEAETQRIFAASGADFHLQVVPGADHVLDNIDKQIEQTEHVTIAEKAAQFFGLAPQGVR